MTELGAVLTKKAFVVWSLYLATCFAFLWGYFTCVTKDYYEALMTYDDRKALEAEKKSWFAMPAIPGMDKEAETTDAMAPAMDMMM